MTHRLLLVACVTVAACADPQQSADAGDSADATLRADGAPTARDLGLDAHADGSAGRDGDAPPPARDAARPAEDGAPLGLDAGLSDGPAPAVDAEPGPTEDAGAEPDARPPLDAGDVIDDPPPAAFCPDEAGGVTYRHRAAFVSSAERPTFEASIPTRNGARFDRLEVEFDFTHGGWYAPDPTGTHSIFQIQRERWQSNLFGFITAFGPGRNEVKVISNIDLPAGELVRLNRRPVRLNPGATYHVAYSYDAARRQRRLRLEAGGQAVMDIQDDQTVDVVELRRSLDLIIGGDLNPAGPEVPTFGWRFENVCVRVR